MKNETNQALQDFVVEISKLAHAVNSFAGNDVVKDIYNAAVKLNDLLQNEKLE